MNWEPTQRIGGEAEMSISLRRGTPADAAILGGICYAAFKAIAEAHSFQPDFPSPDAASALFAACLGHHGFFGLVAEIDGKIVGSNLVDERDSISGIGPITVDPTLQNDGAGRALMQAALRRSQDHGCSGIRLLQAGYHNRTLALYMKLGFEAREQLACVQGPAVGKVVAGRSVRPAEAPDLAACNRLCLQVHGHERGGELADAVAQGTARVVETAGRITGYTTCVAFFGHAVGESNDDLKALIGAAESFPGPGFLVPTRNGDLMRWCLAEGLRIRQTMTLMTVGLYKAPSGSWLPSVTF
jgi:predicted N-acetyltransferase YhbS